MHLSTGNADANGEKTAFQAEKRLFPSGVLFFSLAKRARFPLKNSRWLHAAQNAGSTCVFSRGVSHGF
jgi:hypothetical protein